MAVDIGSLLDKNRMNPRLFGLFLILTVVLIIDGFDLVALGLLAPAVTREFHLAPVSFGWILTANHFGVALGGISGGLIGDAVGRKRAILLAVVMFGLGAIGCALAREPLPFAITRFAAGVGMGAATPNVGAWLVEVMPRKWTSRLTTFAFAASTAGATLCSASATLLLPLAGWRSIFVVGGILPLLILLPISVLVPESPRFLAKHRPADSKMQQALRRLGISTTSLQGEPLVLREPLEQAERVGAIFSSPFLRDTLVFWGATFAIMFAAVGLISLATLLLTAKGLDQQHAVGILVAYNLAGLAGSLSAFLAVHWFGSRRTMTSLLLGGLMGLSLLAFRDNEATVAGIGLTTALMALVGFCLNSSLLLVYPVGAQIYPTGFRAAGSGAAFSFGRIGSTFGSLALTTILSGLGSRAVFGALALAIMLALAFNMALTRHIPARSVTG